MSMDGAARAQEASIRSLRSLSGTAGPALLASALLCLVAPLAVAQDFSLERFTIDGGGEVLSETEDRRWQLSGTIGQWGSSDPLGLIGGEFTLVSGFWPPTCAPALDLFRDGFEASPR